MSCDYEGCARRFDVTHGPGDQHRLPGERERVLNPEDLGRQIVDDRISNLFSGIGGLNGSNPMIAINQCLGPDAVPLLLLAILRTLENSSERATQASRSAASSAAAEVSGAMFSAVRNGGYR